MSLTGQFTAVDGILTGRENLVMIAKMRQADHPRRVADDLLERLLELQPVGSEIWTAASWCIGVLIVDYAFAMMATGAKIA